MGASFIGGKIMIGRSVFGVLLLCSLFFCVGCIEENPLYCTSSMECSAINAASGQPASWTVCHQDNMCVEPCYTDSDCVLRRRGFSADRPFCNLATGRCVAKLNHSENDPTLPDGLKTELLAGEACKETAQCKEGVCSEEGVCCDKACEGGCESCTITGSKGICTLVEKGLDPKNACPILAEACGGKCDGAGACGYAGRSTVCEEGCVEHEGSPAVGQKYCQENGACGKDWGNYESCEFSQCQEKKEESGVITYACINNGRGCTDEKDCIATSACDRSKAHSPAEGNGYGFCINPEQIAGRLTNDEEKADVTAGLFYELKNALPEVTKEKPYLIAEGEPEKGYIESRVTIDSGNEVRIIGLKNKEGSRPEIGPKNKGTLFLVSNGSKLYLQGVKAVLASGTSGYGIQCAGNTGKPGSGLTLIESEILENKAVGVKSNECDVEIRRSEIKGNSGGGVDISKGLVTLSNVKIVENGGKNAQVGGLSLNTVKQGSSLNHLTIAENEIAAGKQGAGAVCVSFNRPGEKPLELRNSIVAGLPSQDSLLFNCAASDSHISDGQANGPLGITVGDPKLNANYELTAESSDCINGASNSLNETVLDFYSKNRKQGVLPNSDKGAVEFEEK